MENIRNITPAEIKCDPEIHAYIERADDSLEARGFTEHSLAHVTKCAEVASGMLSALGYSKRLAELAWIAGYMHDIGNMVNRNDHAQTGAIMAFKLLDDRGMDPADAATVVTAIGHHDDHTAFPVNPVAAALILADKADVRRSRVRRASDIQDDIHDRVNFAVTRSDLITDPEAKTITLQLTLDTQICAVMEYFEIFMQRMELCRKSAEHLGMTFRLTINGQTLL